MIKKKTILSKLMKKGITKVTTNMCAVNYYRLFENRWCIVCDRCPYDNDSKMEDIGCDIKITNDIQKKLKIKAILG